MEKLIYLDQNIISLLRDERFEFREQPDQTVAFSDEHYREIRRSTSSERFLQVLGSLNAVKLTLQMDGSWQQTGNAIVSREVDLKLDFQQYLQNLEDIDFDETGFDALQAMLNGKPGSEGVMEAAISQQLSLHKLIEGFGDSEYKNRIDTVSAEFQKTIREMASKDNDIVRNRARLGIEKGDLEGLKPETALNDIWDLVSKNCDGLTARQFYGFDPLPGVAPQNRPLYSSICGCCAVLDIVGYQAEKKIRKIDRLPNVRSDSGHLGMATFCQAFVTADQRLSKRAKAIYSFLGIPTEVIFYRENP